MKSLFLSIIFLTLTSPNFAQDVTVIKNNHSQLEKGKYIFQAAGCMNCHSPDKTKPLAGGFKITTTFGDFYTPNISSDSKFGIGSWTDKEFIRAVKKGISPRRTFYYPAFPFTSYTKLTDEDVIAMKAYIMTLPPQAIPSKPSELKPPYNIRPIMIGWRALNFRKHFNTKTEEDVFKYQGAFKPRSDKSDSWNRGAYLVEGALHCTECHTPRNKLGGLESKKWMAGAPFDDGKEIAANLTSDSATGKGSWSVADWETLLTDGDTPSGDEVDGDMWLVVKNGTSKLTDEDRQAVITYLQDLKPINNKVEKQK